MDEKFWGVFFILFILTLPIFMGIFMNNLIVDIVACIFTLFYIFVVAVGIDIDINDKGNSKLEHSQN
ncbi:MAG: hypothetical protein ACTSYD_02335 [Candidatus Heimdallarchaeaceae archaeon]